MRPLLAPFVAAIVLAASGTASAGGYVGVGFGSDASLTGDVGDHFDASGETAGKFFLGQRMGNIAVEASFFGTDMNGISSMATTTGPDAFSTSSLGIDVKYHFGLAGPIEGYVRGGVNKTWIAAAPGEETNLDYSGRGLNMGVGAQYRFGLFPGWDAGVFVDYNHQRLELRDSGARPDLNGAIDTLTFGFTIGTLL